MSGAYTVFVDDNFRYMDPEARYCAGTFNTPEAAIAKAKDIVIVSLADLWEPGCTADGLYSTYKQFGEDPFVKGPESEPPVNFSAWDFAKAMAAYMATLRGSAAVAA
jgi:hypothetical protein